MHPCQCAPRRPDAERGRTYRGTERTVFGAAGGDEMLAAGGGGGWPGGLGGGLGEDGGRPARQRILQWSLRRQKGHATLIPLFSSGHSIYHRP